MIYLPNDSFEYMSLIINMLMGIILIDSGKGHFQEGHKCSC